MVHYPTIMLSIGPLVHVWCMRFEAKHKEGKIAAHVITSRTNLPLTLAKRHQLKLCDRFLNDRGFTDDITFGRDVTVNIKSSSNFKEFKTLLPSSYYAVSWIETKGIKYATKIVIDSSGPEADAPIFCEIELVFICEKNKLFFIIKSLDIVEFCSHVNAYKIKCTQEWRCLSYESMHCVKASSILRDINGDTFVTWY